MIYRLMVKDAKGIYRPVEGMNTATKQPVFVTNVINGLCFWNISSDEKTAIENRIKAAYPNIEFELRKTL